MARIIGAGPKGAYQKLVYWMVKRQLGRIPNPMKISAHSKPVFKGRVGMEQALQKFNAVPASILSLVQTRVAMRIGCPF